MVKHLVIVVLLALSSHAAAQDFDYIKRDTREASRDATLAQYFPALTASEWSIVGPFDNRGRNKLGVALPPEDGVDLDATYEGKGGATVAWTTLPGTEWPRINLKRFDSNDDAIAYLYREVSVDDAVEVTFEAGSDDGLMLWINGRLVIDADQMRGFNIDQHRITVPLRAGVNTVLAKVSQGAGGWEFQLRPRMDSRILSQLDYHLEIDFPSTPEAEYYRVLSVLEPEDVVLEVGGIDLLPDGRPIISTRRGEVWIVDGAYDEPPFNSRFTRFASGLHEPLGALWHEGGLLVAQRGELTKLVDVDGDDRADAFETICDGWGVSGNYHEFAFGPELDADGAPWVTLNLGFCGSLGKSIVPWRGWALKIEDDGSITPICGGLRSPNGIGRNAAGAMFYTDNQGDWIATNKLSHMDVGDWHGHPGGNRWYEDAGMTPPRGEQDFKPPAVWFPYNRMGRSASDIILDTTGGAFGPFDGQLFVGDQFSAEVMRVDLEQVDGVWQGTCFPFRRGFDCGVNRMVFGTDGSLFVGMTNRGWGSLGRRPWGLQRVVWTGVVPFEMKTVRIQPDGFVVSFTKPIDPSSAQSDDAVRIASFTHHRHDTYGSDEIDRRTHEVTAIEVADDGLSLQLRIGAVRGDSAVTEIHMPGLRSTGGETLLHDIGFYTVNVVP